MITNKTDNKMETSTEQTQVQPTTLAGKILAIKSRIGKIGKDGSSIVGGKNAPAKTVKYATLTSILERVVPLFVEYGIDYTVSPVFSDAAIAMMPQEIRFFSIHFTDVISGENTEPIIYPFMRASNPEPIKADGSTLTYAVRYLLGLALGIQTEEDPDARIQQKPAPKPQQQAQPQNKVRTFPECKNGFYTVLNNGDFDGAKKTLDFIERNWGDKNEYKAEIEEMKTKYSTTTKEQQTPF